MVQARMAMKNIDHGLLMNHPASRELNPEAPQTLRLSQVVRSMSSKTEALHTKSRTQWPMTGQRKCIQMCRLRCRVLIRVDRGGEMVWEHAYTINDKSQRKWSVHLPER